MLSADFFIEVFLEVIIKTGYAADVIVYNLHHALIAALVFIINCVWEENSIILKGRSLYA